MIGSPTPQRLVAIADRLQRAHENIEEIKQYLVAYYASDVYQLAGIYDPRGIEGQQLYFAGAIVPPPVRFFTLVGDVLHELRSVLDQLAWQLVCEIGNTPSEDTRWPLLRVSPSSPQRGPDRGLLPPPYVAGGVGERALEIISSSQPYRYLELDMDPAMHPLYVLDRLNIVDKHRHIAIRQAHFVNTHIAGVEPIPRFDWDARTVSSDEHGAVVALIPTDPTVDAAGKTTLQVFLHEIPEGVNREVLLTLREAFNEVSQIFVQCSEECFSLP